jgi:hypothetical protein
VSYGCDDGTIGPCAPGTSRSEATLGSGSHDEPTGTGQILDTVGSLGKQVIDDTTYLLTSPLRIDGKSALILGGVAAGIGGLMVADKTIQRAFQDLIQKCQARKVMYHELSSCNTRRLVDRRVSRLSRIRRAAARVCSS